MTDTEKLQFGDWVKRGDEIGMVHDAQDGPGNVIVIWTLWNKSHNSVQSCMASELEPITLDEARMLLRFDK